MEREKTAAAAALRPLRPLRPLRSRNHSSRLAATTQLLFATLKLLSNYPPLPSNYSHPLRPKAVPLTPQNSPQAQRYPNKTPRHASSRKKMRVTKSKFVTLIFGKVYSASIRLCRYHRYTRQRKNPIPKRSTAARSSSSLTLGSAIEISSLARSANDLLRR